MTETPTAFEDVDFFSDLTIVDDPYPYFDWIRAKGPVWIDPRLNVAVVTGHAEAIEVYRDGELFSSCNSPTGPFPGLPEPVEDDDAGPVMDRCRDQLPMHEFMATMDPPQHGEHRGLLTGLFTPRRLKENEDFMWRLADEQIDKFLSGGTCEFISEYASPFAGLVIADLLGVPKEDMPRFRAGFERSARANFTVEENADLLADNPIAFIDDIVKHYIEERRSEPRRDILTHLAQARFSDGTQPDAAVLSREASFLFAAGQETTVRLMSFAVQHLAENPDVQEHLRRNRTLIPTYLEEILRLESPVKCHFRMARRRTTLGGVDIPAGMSIMLLPGAANRDPRQFDNPSLFKLERANVREQLAFGRGAHSCIGQPLARSEARVTLERMFDRMADIRISEVEHGTPDERHFEYVPTWIFRGLTTIFLEFDAVAAP
jgi:cytochrome P450